MLSLYEIEWLKQVSKDLPEHKETVKRARPMTNEEVIEKLSLEEGYPSRKHFQQVADIIKTIKDPAEKQRMAQHHADVFAAQNPRFNHAKWHQWIGTKNHHTEETQIDETLPANAKAGDYVDDFVHSKNKMFSGDSKKQRIKRALGAYYSKKRHEETELSENGLSVKGARIWDKAHKKGQFRGKVDKEEGSGVYGGPVKPTPIKGPKLYRNKEGVLRREETEPYWKKLLELYGKGSVEKIGNWHARMQDKQNDRKKYAYHDAQANRAEHLGMAISARADRKYAEKSEKSNLAKASFARAKVKAMKEGDRYAGIGRPGYGFTTYQKKKAVSWNPPEVQAKAAKHKKEQKMFDSAKREINQLKKKGK